MGTRVFFLLCFAFSAVYAQTLQTLPQNLSKESLQSLLKEFSTPEHLYKKEVYHFTKGWNKFITPKDGINVEKTFHNNKNILSILTYYPTGKIWAIYSPKEKRHPNMLFLKYLEPHVTFFLLAKKAGTASIKSNHLTGICREKSNTPFFATVLDSGINKAYTTSSDKIMALQSRYYSHHDRGIYNDTRVALIYPLLHVKKERTLKYGPAKPKIAIKFPKEYEEKTFFLYDYKLQKCFEGIFPSRKIPPFPVLKELQE